MVGSVHIVLPVLRSVENDGFELEVEARLPLVDERVVGVFLGQYHFSEQIDLGYADLSDVETGSYWNHFSRFLLNC